MRRFKVITFLVFLAKLTTMINGYIEGIGCSKWCIAYLYVNTVIIGLLFILLGYTVTRLMHFLRKRQRYLYNKYLWKIILASLIVTSSCIADIYFNIVLIKHSGNLFDTETTLIRNIHKLVLFTPAVIISFVFKPKDLFAEFNMFPE